MVQNDLILSTVFEVYRTKRSNAENKAYEIRESLFKDNYFSDLHYKIKSLSLDILKAKYNGDNKTALELEKEKAVLKEKEEKYLEEKGLSKEDLKPKYSCSKCEDSAYTKEGKLCDCFFKTLAEVAEDLLDITPPQLPSFSQFVCKNKLDEKNRDFFVEYSNKFPDVKTKNLILTGTTGTGKTFSAGCIAKAVKEKNNIVIYLSATKLINVFLRYHTAPLGDKKAIFDLLTCCDLLVIDDLGTEPMFNNITMEYLTSFLSERINNKKSFIITTNLSMDEIKTRYSERLFSRLSGKECGRINFSGEDLRLKK